MENVDLIVLRTLHQWREAGKRALLVTVIRTWGSSPRPVGSIMALSEDGAVVGSVSGGCIEDNLINRYVRGAGDEPLNEQLPQVLTYGIRADEAHRFGLPCGGTLELVLEYNLDPRSLGALVALVEQGRLVQRTVCLSSGDVDLKTISAVEEALLDTQTYSNVFGPQYRLLLIGAGQLSEYLAMMATFNGFSVTVCDPREEYYSSWSQADVTLVHEMPDDAVKTFKPDSRSGVIALTHDPKLDDLALLEALATDAFYVGAIGSRRNNQARRRRMIDYLDQTEQSLKKLRGPVGIYIGSKTPSEIAVSIMAEIIAIKNGVVLPVDLNVEWAKESLDSQVHC